MYDSELVMYIIMYCECIVSSLSLCNGVKSVVVVLETDVSGESDRACCESVSHTDCCCGCVAMSVIVECPT